MDLPEYEATLSDLETRLDRLKVLYEQWFQGLERLEPAIPRKEVERRFYMMRKEQVRNTALRFRFQQLVQRYTTYIAYWGRVARQIEEGTYRRDVMKMRQQRQDYRARMKGGGAYEIDIDIDPMEDGLGADADVDAALAAFDTEAPTSAVTRSPAPVPPSPPIPAEPSTGARPMLSPFSFGRPQPVAQAARGAEPATATFGRPVRSEAPTTSLQKLRPEPKTADIPTTTFARAGAAAPPPIAAPSSAPTKPLVAPARPPAAPTAAPAPARPLAAAAAVPGRPFGAPPSASAATRTAPAATQAAVPQRPVGPGGLPSAGTPARPAISPLGAPRPPVAPPASQPRPPAPVPPVARPAPRDVSDDQIRAVYDRYVDARRKNNERTDNVRYETLAKSLRDMVPKLREKHSGKSIDFEIVVKDGKVGIKPVPKG